MTMIKPVHLNGHTNVRDQETERLTLRVADLQAENRGLRRRLPESTGDMRRLRQAHRDARAMLLHRFNGYSISRANCLTLGIPRRRWPWAMALLKLARVVVGGEVVVTDFDAAIGALDRSFREQENAGSIGRLKMRLPPSALGK